MSTFVSRKNVCVMTVLFAASTVFSQMKSAIQFYDSTGDQPTCNFGWSGTVSDGHFFIGTPSGNDMLTIKNGNAVVTGSVTAERFSGDGSGLTNIPGPTDLDDQLNTKADLSGAAFTGNISAPNLLDSLKVLQLIAGKADITGTTFTGNISAPNMMDSARVESKLSGKANLSGAVFTGSISAPNMLDSSKIDTRLADKADLGGATFTGQVAGTEFLCGGAKFSDDTIQLVPGTTIFAYDQSVGGGFYERSLNFFISGGITSRYIFDAQSTNNAAIVQIRNLSLGTSGNDNFISTSSGSLDLQPASGIVTVNGSTVSTSDSAFKKNITPIRTASEMLYKINGVYFDYKTDVFPSRNFPDGRQVGVIAQNVEKVFPELVYTDNAGYKSVAYEKLTAVLIEAFKDQQNEIDELKMQIAELKAVLAAK